MNIRRCSLLMSFSLLMLASCEKYPVLPNHDPRSKGKRISRSWHSDQLSQPSHSAAIDNTRVAVIFNNYGKYDWIVTTNVLGVESASVHHGQWKFIDQQSKLVLEETRGPFEKKDTFSILTLTANRLKIQQTGNPTIPGSILELVAD
ncbi:MAG: hypothetical protein FJZ80_06710 [Bacteroidetes bacterium]|nr:hypothetical protein [Bacteroidota bacterium]MBM3424126.1 hypothetical protein [Bacteroidota bacterium]